MELWSPSPSPFPVFFSQLLVEKQLSLHPQHWPPAPVLVGSHVAVELLVAVVVPLFGARPL